MDGISKELGQAMKVVVFYNNLHCAIHESTGLLLKQLEAAIYLGTIDEELLKRCFSVVVDEHEQHLLPNNRLKTAMDNLSKLIQEEAK